MALNIVADVMRDHAKAVERSEYSQIETAFRNAVVKTFPQSSGFCKTNLHYEYGKKLGMA